MRKSIALLSAGFALLGASEALAEENEAWTVQRYQREFCGNDPWEPFNRSMFGIFDWCMEYVVDPFCYVYSSIVPKPLIKGIDNFCENVEYPRRLVANLLMGEGRLAWASTVRFFVNTTVGVGGLFDVADSWMGISDDQASLSDTFTCWGIPSGPRLSLPFMPRASLRGHVGYVLDYAFDGKTWFDIFFSPGIPLLGYSWALTPNKAPIWRGYWEDAFYQADDPYAIFMPLTSALSDFNLKQRMAHVVCDGEEDWRPPVHASAARPDGLKGSWREIPGFAPRGPAIDSLRALCFKPIGDDDFWWERRSVFNRDFSKRIDLRKVEIGPDLPKAECSFVAAPEADEGTQSPERLVFVLPGIGAGRTASEAVAMAEFLNSNGCGVVLCNSLFHWKSMRSVNRGILPGNLPEDARRFADYMAKIVADLQNDGLVRSPEISVMGWSMGGLATLHLAALDARGALPLAVSHFISINPPPTSFARGTSQSMHVMEASRSWSKETAREMFMQGACALYGWAKMPHPRYDPAHPPKDGAGAPWDYSPNLTEEQADYLLGMTLRTSVQALVAERHRQVPFDWIKSELTTFHRSAFYDEIDQIGLVEYLEKCLPQCYPGMTAEEICAQTDIRHIEASLACADRLSVLHTWNDPLLEEEDRRYFDAVFGPRITWFADGAHCGYFYTKPFQDELLLRLALKR